MHHATKLGVVIFSTTLFIGGTCAAQQNPGGSYQQTCRDIGTRGSTLYATCQDGVGGWRSTELANFQRCRGEIQNINGQLQCSSNGRYQSNNPRGPGDHDRDGNSGYGQGRVSDRDRDHDRDGDSGNGQGRVGDRDRDHDRDGNDGYNRWPAGSYTQTCRNINISGDTLQASCEKKNGKWKQTSLRNYNRCSAEVVNNNGKLQCAR